MTRPAPVTRRELGLAALGLALLAAAAYGSHLADGSFYYDDWAIASAAQHSSGVFGLMGQLDDTMSGRPVLLLLFPALHTLFGLGETWHLASAVAMAVAMAWAAHLLLREVGLERVHAGAIAALTLLFPFADTARLWPTATQISLAATLALLGLVVSARAFTAARRGLLLHAAGLALMVAGILTYELVAGPVLLSLLMYRTRTAWAPALRRYALDAVAVGVCLAWVASQSVHDRPPVSGWPDRAWTIFDQSTLLLTSVALPFGTPRRVTVVGLMLAVAAVGALVWRLSPKAAEARRELARWLVAAGVAALAVGASYVVLVPGEPYYVPLQGGIGNRINTVAAPAFVALVYALAMVAATVAFRDLPGWRRLSAGFAVLVALAIGIGYLDRLDHDKERWAEAAEIQAGVLSTLDEALPSLPRDATVFTFGHPLFTAPGVPVFAANWDLTGALRIAHDDETIQAYPVAAGAVFECGADALTPTQVFTTPAEPLPYPDVFFADAATGATERLDDAQACESALRAFQPGPLELYPG